MISIYPIFYLLQGDYLYTYTYTEALGLRVVAVNQSVVRFLGSGVGIRDIYIYIQIYANKHIARKTRMRQVL